MKTTDPDFQGSKSLLESLSFRLASLKFAAIILVLYNHSYTPVVHMRSGNFHLENFKITMFVETFFSKNFVTPAVPLFFAVSGLIFFLKNYQENYGMFVWKKCKSILWPYFLWNSICIAYMFLLQGLPFTKKYFVCPDIIPSWGWHEWVNAYIGVDASWYPYLYPLWFLPILFFVFLIIPPLKKYFMEWPGLIAAMIAAHIILSYFPQYLQSPIHHTAEGFSFFCFGYFIVRHLNMVDSQSVCILSGCFYFAVNLLRTIYAAQMQKYLPNIADSYAGVVFLFSVSRYIPVLCTGRKTFFAVLFSFSFVIYVMHENALSIIRKLAFMILPAWSCVPLIIFFMIPLCLIAVLSIFGYLLKRKSPAFYYFLFGR